MCKSVVTTKKSANSKVSEKCSRCGKQGDGRALTWTDAGDFQPIS